MSRRIFSNEPTALAYDGAPSAENVLPEELAGHRVIVQPGVNELSDKDVALLKLDQHFERAMKGGYIVDVPDEEPVPAQPAKPAGKGGKTKAASTDLAPEVAKERDDFLALTADEQAAMYAALTPEAKAAVDAARDGK